MSDLIFPSNYPGIKLVDSVIRRRLSSTVIQSMVNGQEARVSNWSYPRYEWEIDFAALRNFSSSDSRSLEFQNLFGMFNQLSGPFDTFLFPDLFSPDYVVHGQFIANGDGHTTQFQMYRTFGTSTEPVYALNNVGLANPNYGWIQPVVYLNGFMQSSGWGMNADTGILTFTSAPGAGVAITADFSYFWRVRLSEDSQEFSECWPQVWATHSPVKFISVRQ